MRLGILGDIHGNILALEKCYKFLKDEGCEAFYHVGDLVGFGPFPNECVDFIRAYEIPGARGNYDENTSYQSKDAGIDFGSFEEHAIYYETFLWTRDVLKPGSKSLLMDLPFDVTFKEGKHTFSLFHANPFDIYTAITEKRSEGFMKEVADYTHAKVNVFAHTHVPFYRVVDGIHFINVGAVGNPKDGDPRASCVIVDLNDDIKVQIKRLEYDVQKVADAVKRTTLPPEIADRLLSGR